MENIELDMMKKETLKIFYDYLSALTLDVKEVSDLFRKDELHEGLSCISELTKGFEIVIEGATGIDDVLKNGFNANELVEFIKETVEALENEDYVLLGDLLEYEIHPILSNLKENVENSIKIYN